jgi:hypothetical protein
MIRKLFGILYGSSPADFVSVFGVEESVARLANATKRSVFQAIAEQAAVGEVSRERVRLSRVRPFVGNSFRTFYVGEFVETDGRVRLQGRFTLSRGTKAFMTLWFGLVLVWTALALTYAILAEDAEAWLFPLAGVAMLAAGLGLLVLFKRLAGSDRPWLSNVIEGALSQAFYRSQ